MDYEPGFVSYLQGKLRRWVHRLGPDQCWPYIGQIGPHGYGQLTWHYNGRSGGLTASRAMGIASGIITERAQHCLHSCDNPPCCNPAHLRAGSRTENMKDARERGRRAKRYRPHTRVKKLSDDDVRAIRSDPRDVFAIAKDFGVSNVTIYNIKARRRKAGVPDIVNLP